MSRSVRYPVSAKARAGSGAMAGQAGRAVKPGEVKAH